MVEEVIRKMPKCPKCGKEINCLIVHALDWEEYEVRLDEKGELEWVPLDGWASDFAPIYLCPECNGLLFVSEKDATGFLKIGKREG
jgi:hypothetical protein